MAYNDDAQYIGSMEKSELKFLLEELLSKLSKSKINVVAFSQPNWANRSSFCGSYPNNPLHTGVYKY